MRLAAIALVTVALLAVTDWRVPMAAGAALPWLAAWVGVVIVASTIRKGDRQRAGL